MITNNIKQFLKSNICLQSDKKVFDFRQPPSHDVHVSVDLVFPDAKACFSGRIPGWKGILASLALVFSLSAATGWGQTAQSLPYSFSSGVSGMTSVNGWSQSGIGSDYADTTTPIKFDTTSDTATLLINSSPNVLTYYLKGNSFSGGTFTVQQSADGTSWSTVRTVTTLTTGNVQYTDNLNSTTRRIRWTYTTKVSGNVGMGTIAITAAMVTPTVTTPTVSSISTTSATLGANVTANGGASITSRGTVWGTSSSPTGNSLAEGGTSTGTFSHSRTGLTANTLYY